MKFLDKLDRRFGRFAIPHLTEALIAGQVLAYLAVVLGQNNGLLESLYLMPSRVLDGEVVRLFSFVIVPPPMSPIFAFFFWYLFYLMGATLETTWGTFRYNLFLLVGYLATVAVAFLTPEAPTHALFLQGSVFLAFAYLYPDFQLMLFFILPVKIKWLAWLQWIGYFVTFASGPWPAKLAVLAATLNFLLFFGKDIWVRIRSGRRRMSNQTRQIKQARTPRHVCRICGINNLDDPKMDFRYCSKCDDASCYCEEHLRNHEHIRSHDESLKS